MGLFGKKEKIEELKPLNELTPLEEAEADEQKKYALYIENFRKLNEDPENSGFKKQVNSDRLSWQDAQEKVADMKRRGIK